MTLPEKDIAAFLRQKPETLGEALRSALPSGAGVVIAIEHLEDLARADPADARDFAAAIASILEVPSAPLRVLATLRADRMDPLFSLEPLRPLLTRGFYPVRPLTGESLRRAMIEPALTAGYHVEDASIVDDVASDLSRQPGALPLLSFAMSEWWEARDDATRTLPSAAWRAIGGLAGALTRHADRVVEAMGVEERRAADQILVRLVTAERTRTRVARGLLLDAAASGPHAPRALERLVGAKLVVETGDDVELAHEALITVWPRLRGLLVSSGEDRAFRERVAAAARQWDQQGRPRGTLWSEEQAQRLGRWFAATNAPLDQVELAFVEAVRRHAARRRIAVRAAVVLVTLAALAFGFVATANEHEMAKRLGAAEARATDRERAYVHAESRRLKGVAAANLERDPASALRLTDASYELEHDRSLDVLAWDARTRGIAVPMPGFARDGTSPASPGRGQRLDAALVRTSAENGLIAAASGANVYVVSPKSAEHASLRASTDPGVAVRSTAFSPDGQVLFVGTSDGRISSTPSSPFSLSDVARCPGPVRHLWPLSRDAVFAECGATSGGRLVWAARGASRDVFEGAIGGAAYARDARILLVATRDGHTTLVDASGATHEGLTLPITGEVTALDVAPDATSALVGAANGDVVLVTLAGAKKPPSSLGHHAKPVVSVWQGPKGEWLSVGEDREALLSGGGAQHRIALAEPTFAWIEGRNAMALVTESGAIRVASLETGESLGELRAPGHEVSSLSVDPRGEWLFEGGRDGSVHAFNLDQATVALTTGPQVPAPSACALSSDGTSVGCASPSGAWVRVVAQSVGAFRPPVAFASSPETQSTEQVALDVQGRSLFWVAKGAVVHEGHLPLAVLGSTSAALTTDERLVLAGQDTEGRPALSLLPFALDQRAAPVVLPSAATALAWNAARRELLVAAGRHVRQVDASSGATLTDRSVESEVAPGDAVTALASSDDGASLALGTRLGRVLFAGKGGGTFREVASLRVPIRCVAWARSGEALVVAAGQKGFAVSVDAGTAFAFWTAPAALAACARAPDEDRVSFVGYDGTAWLKAFDFSGVAESYVPPDPATPEAMPTLATWKGLPVGLVR
jgi:WD40 repeat protein